VVKSAVFRLHSYMFFKYIYCPRTVLIGSLLVALEVLVTVILSALSIVIDPFQVVGSGVPVEIVRTVIYAGCKKWLAFG